MIAYIRKTTGETILKRKLAQQKRKKTLVNINDAESIVLIYKVTDERRFRAVKKIVKELDNEKRKVHALGYIDDKEMPDYCIAETTGYYFNNQNLNWYGGPKIDYLKKAIKKENDILIDLSTSNDYIIEYIIALSMSKLKVGRKRPNMEKYFDLMISLKDKAPLSEFFNEAIHYLTILKSK